MNKKRNLNLYLLTSSLLVLGLMLAGCSPATVTPAAPGSDTATADGAAATATIAQTATEAPTATNNAPSTAGGACLIGSWKLTDFAPYMDSVKQNITENTSNDVTFTSGTLSGTATFVFNPDHTSSLTADDFSQSFTMTMSVTDSPVEIPISLLINGTSTADYAVEGDTITFTNQNGNDMSIAVDTMGSVTTLDESMFGEPDTVKLYQFSCVDATTLSLKVIAVDDMDLTPLILTRAQ